ncbi:sucrase ferredoxin [Streptomyces reniochalinae]|uniref:Sucrase ferredoxin n=1 Tax=Streptomyces reniochalinae TaxID=2250578 RepID=A0A367E5R7_9ACTN|nr:sucrase ferredoxin [Streptomyces reniochalinae]RCG13351.1 sucrase ferredoxin [Streptomyces reniochalinae]
MSTCATASRILPEPLAGTAATARTWLLVEQPGPWGRKALTQSRLDPGLGQALDAAASAHGARVALIRRPGRHADHSPAAGHRVYLARTVPGDSWVLTARLPGDGGLEALRDLDFAAFDDPAAGARGAAARPRWEPYEGEPLALVCTNGKRDRCCALLGRPLAAELAASGGANVWEITHLGGHRFAPTLLVLPHGYAYGRLDAAGTKSVLDAVRDGRMSLEGCRGRSAWDRPGQAADLAVRERTGELRAEALSVRAVRTGTNGSRRIVTVAHVDGRRWRVVLREHTGGPAVPASCGAEPAGTVRLDVEALEEGQRAAGIEESDALEATEGAAADSG